MGRIYCKKSREVNLLTSKIAMQWVLLLSTLLVLMISICLEKQYVVWFYVVLWTPLSIGWILLFASVNRVGGPPFLKKFCGISFLRTTGNMSFELFLMHQLVLRYLSRIFKNSTNVALYKIALCVLAFFISLFLAFSWKKIENMYTSQMNKKCNHL